CGLAPDGDPADLLAFTAELALEREHAPDHLGVEGARKAAVAGDRDDRDGVDLLPLLQEREPPDRRARSRGAGHQRQHAVGVGAHRLDPRLRLAELRRGDELHRARDLPRVRDGADPPPDVRDGGYETSASSRWTLKVWANFLSAASSFAVVSSARSPVSRISL